jgi:ADP-dependent NAD(P)H-hydrate dehydratase / NAD(P)H-hydrate epimerase
MYAADAAAAAAGVAGETLMEAAGWQVANAIRRRFSPRPVAVLCGPGNNGGDGFVAARLLDGWGWPVRLGLLGEVGRLKGDAAVMAARWRGPMHPLTEALLQGDPLVVDALFGAGLARPLEGAVRAIVEAVVERQLDAVAVDIPSGIDGNTGRILGAAMRASVTVTFFRPKPGHALLPGRLHCGELVVGDIGIPEEVLGPIAPKTFVNGPGLWGRSLAWPRAEGHKYARGHLLVAGGAVMTGAARLVALAGRRSGAGLTTIVGPESALAVYRSGPPGTIVQSLAQWDDLLADPRRNAVVLGPGLGVGEETRRLVRSALAAGKSCVLDADAITSFAEARETLWGSGTAVLTPHDGEYARLFPGQSADRADRLRRARQAAAESGWVMLLKGPDTVIAAPDGRAAVTVDAPADLATGGTGDVLAGMIGGLLAQGMAPFEAAAAGAWMHGAAARAFGPGLIAEDLIDGLPGVWRTLRARLGGRTGEGAGPAETHQ